MPDQAFSVVRLAPASLCCSLQHVRVDAAIAICRFSGGCLEKGVRAGLRAVWSQLHADRRALDSSCDLTDQHHVFDRRRISVKPLLSNDRAIRGRMSCEQLFVVAIAERAAITQGDHKREANTDRASCASNSLGIGYYLVDDDR